MSSGKWCDLGEQLGGNIDALGADIIDSAAEIDGVPQDNGMDVDVVIAEFCANPPTKDPSEDGKLRAAEGETSTLEWETLNRDNWLAANAAPPSH